LIWLNLLFGGLFVPLLLFVAATVLNGLRKKRGLGEYSPQQVSLVIMMLTLASWVIVGLNILSHLI
jgi:hypothetical protein